MPTPGMPSESQQPLTSLVDRRSFLGFLGAGAGVLPLSSCRKDDSEEDNRPSIALGSGDLGLLRMGIAMETFLVSFFGLAAAVRLSAETNLKNHLLTMQNMHQAYLDLLVALTNGDVPGPLEYDTSKINMRNVSQTAANGFYLLDVASSAYSGMAERFTDPAKSLAAVKMAASCARQSTVLRPIHTSSNWAIRASTNITGSTGLSASRSPSQVASALDPFLVNRWDTSQLP